ncbi:MAG TPA: hypothetical protein ACQGQI_08145 [Xylella sp.]
MGVFMFAPWCFVGLGGLSGCLTSGVLFLGVRIVFSKYIGGQAVVWHCVQWQPQGMMYRYCCCLLRRSECAVQDVWTGAGSWSRIMLEVLAYGRWCQVVVPCQVRTGQV